MKTAADRLRKAKARIADPAHWTRGHFALTRSGRPTHPRAVDAVSWCATGACEAERVPISHLRECLPPFASPVAHYNDASTTTHEDIMRLFDCAIEKAESS